MRSTSTSSTRTFQTPPAQVETPPKRPRRQLKVPHLSKKQLPWIIIIVLIVAGGFLFSAYRGAKAKLNSSGPAYNQRLVTQLQKVIELPPEQPTIATVKNAAKIDNLAFYKNAENGDVLFVYSVQHEAILFRPSTNLIVNVSTDINVNSSGTTVGQQ